MAMLYRALGIALLQYRYRIIAPSRYRRRLFCTCTVSKKMAAERIFIKHTNGVLDHFIP